MQPKQPPDKRSTRILWQEAFRAMSLGWELAVPIFAGALLGHALDRWLGTGHILTLGLLGLGIFAGFYSIWRFHQRFQARERQIEDEEREDREG